MISWRDWIQKPAPDLDLGPIGLDLGPEALHLIQVERSEEGVKLHAGCSLAYPAERELLPQVPPRALRAYIRDALKTGGFSGNEVVVSAPRKRVKLQVFNYEVPEGRSDAEVILGMVRERSNSFAAGSVVDYVPMRTAGGQRGEMSALVAVASQEEMMADLAFLDSMGLDVRAIEVAPLAIHRLVAWAARSNLAQNSLVIHCGDERSDLAVLWGRRLILYREIDFGERPLVDALSQALDVDGPEAAGMLRRYGLPADPGEKSEDELSDDDVRSTLLEILRPNFAALADQVDRALVYTASKSHGAVVEHVYLSGRLANWPGSDTLLDGLLSIPVSVLDARNLLATDEKAMLDCGVGITLAAGCALRGVSVDG